MGRRSVSEECSGEEPVRFAVASIDDRDVEAVAAVLRSGWLTTGEQCLALEAELAAHVGAPHVVAVSSCTAALEIALAALDLAPGAQVGVSAWTFVSAGLAVLRAGAVPVLLDVDPRTLNVSPAAVEAALDTGLDALQVTHFGGVPVDESVHAMAADRPRPVPVIEDAAHALGARDHRGPISGEGSVAACYSFYATKNLTSAEGGALATHSDDVARFARAYRLHGLDHDAWARYRPGSRPEYDLVAEGIKANLPDVLAALARSQLARFDELQARRRKTVERYRMHLAGIDGVVPVPPELYDDGADHLMVVLLPEGADRMAVVETLSSAGVASSVHFRPLHHFARFAARAEVGPAGTATADALAPRALSLPLHAELSDHDVDRVCHALAEVLGA